MARELYDGVGQILVAISMNYSRANEVEKLSPTTRQSLGVCLRIALGCAEFA